MQEATSIGTTAQKTGGNVKVSYSSTLCCSHFSVVNIIYKNNKQTKKEEEEEEEEEEMMQHCKYPMYLMMNC